MNKIFKHCLDSATNNTVSTASIKPQIEYFTAIQFKEFLNKLL